MRASSGFTLAFLAKAMEGKSHSFSHGDKYYEHIPSNGLSLAYDIIYYVCSTITLILGNCVAHVH